MEKIRRILCAEIENISEFLSTIEPVRNDQKNIFERGER